MSENREGLQDSTGDPRQAWRDWDSWPAQTRMWRVGRKVGRTIYAQCEPHRASDDDRLIGLMDTADLAAEAVRAHNQLAMTSHTAGSGGS